jgi:glucokinase
VSDSDFVLGIDLGGTKMALTTARPDGALLRVERHPTEAARGAEQAFDRAIAAGLRLVEETAAESGGALRAVGLSTMGVTRSDSVLMAPNVPGWDHLAIPGRLRHAFPDAPHGIENDVKAATRAELRWGALQGCRNAIYLNLGTGIAAGLVVDGAVLGGANGAAGEIAYNLRTPHEEMGAALGHAPLEEYVGGRAIGERATLRFGRPLTTRGVFERADADVEARGLIEEALGEMLFQVTNLAIALDPERIAVGGGLMASEALILPRLQAHMRRFVPFPPTVVPASLVHDAGLMGGVALAVEAWEQTRAL